MSLRLKKVARYVRLYGPSRTYTKVLAQRHAKGIATEIAAPTSSEKYAKGSAECAFVGCGKFAFSTLAYFLTRDFGKVVRVGFDLDPQRAASFADRYRASYWTTDFERIVTDDRVRIVFVATNHASHADYAIRCLRAGKSVHLEKPPAVTEAGLRLLIEAAASGPGSLTLGYNRPCSPLGELALAALQRETGPMAQSWFVAGHRIPGDHWYLQSQEGGRVLGNLCHWIDFALRPLRADELLPLTITVPPAPSIDEPINVTYRFGDGSTATLTFSATDEPFEGVRERYTAQRGQTLVQMSDFERLRIDRGSRITRRRHLFRDHGHRRAVERSVQASRGLVPPDDLGHVWRSGILAIWTRECVESGRSRTITDWRFDFAADTQTDRSIQ